MRFEEKFGIGADVISLMIHERHPLILVDRITAYKSSPKQIFSQCHISANDPVFLGHFPEFKLWPGIYTLEGLRQSCMLLDVLRQLEEVGYLDRLISLQKYMTLQPAVDLDLYQPLLDLLNQIRQWEFLKIKLHLKLLAPVFAGCVMNYYVCQNNSNYSWFVQAEVNGHKVAKGEISLLQDV